MPERVLRTAPKVKMKIEFTDKQIDSEIQLSENIIEFVKRLQYVDRSML